MMSSRNLTGAVAMVLCITLIVYFQSLSYREYPKRPLLDLDNTPTPSKPSNFIPTPDTPAQNESRAICSTPVAKYLLPAEFRRSARSMLMAIDSVMTKANAQYIIIGGTLLGQQRHTPPGPMPWDDDVDIQVVAETPEELAEMKLRVFRELWDNSQTSPFNKCHLHNDSVWEGLQCLLKVDPDRDKLGTRLAWLDIFFSTFEDFEDFNDSGRTPYLTRFKTPDPPSRWAPRNYIYKASMHPKWVFPLQRCPYMDFETWCPARPIQVLTQQFGESVMYTLYTAGPHGSKTKAVTLDMRHFPVLFRSGTTDDSYEYCTIQNATI